MVIEFVCVASYPLIDLSSGSLSFSSVFFNYGVHRLFSFLSKLTCLDC